VLGITTVMGRLARLDRGDSVVLFVLLFGSASVGLIMLPLMLFHMIQLPVCAVIAGRLSRVPAQDEDVRRPP
jgi:sodium/bile acid cotransporter 7